MTIPASPGAAVDLVVCGTLSAALFVDQRLPIGDRDLIVIRWISLKARNPWRLPP